MDRNLFIRTVIGLLITSLFIGPASAWGINDANTWIDNGIKSLLPHNRGIVSEEQSNRLPSLSIMSYDSSVPVQIGYNKAINYWVLTGTVGWKMEQIVLIKLPSGIQDEGKTPQISIPISFEPLGVSSKAPLTRFVIPYKNSVWDTDCQSYGCGGGVSVPAYKVEGGAWSTSTKYDVKMGSNDYQIVNVGYDYPSKVNLAQGVYVDNLGYLPNGVNVPSGEFVILIDPWEYPHIVRELDLQNAITWWDVNYYWADDTTWTGVWNKLQQNGKLPREIVLSANPSYTSSVSYICEDGLTHIDCNSDAGKIQNAEYKYVKVSHPLTSASSMISVYIPSGLASTVNVVIPASIPSIVGTPTITSVSDKQYALLSVTVKNIGGTDYITVKPTSQYYSFVVVDTNSKVMNSGDTATFTFKAYAMDVAKACDKCAPVNVLVEGSDPYKSKTETVIYGTIYDSDTAVNTDADLTIKPIDPDGRIVSNALIYVNGELKGEGQKTIKLPKGEYTVSSKNVTGLFAPLPLSVTMNGVSKSVELRFSHKPQQNLDLTWILWGAIVLIVVVISYQTGFLKTVYANPMMLAPVLFVILVLWFLWPILISITTFGGLFK